MMPETISTERQGVFSTGDFFSALCFGLFWFALIPAGVCWGLAQLHYLAALASSMILYLLVTLILLGVRAGKQEELDEKRRAGELDKEMGHSLAIMAALFVMFGMLSAAVQAASAGQFHTAVAVPGTSEWLLFATDHLIQAVTLGVPAVYELHLAEISPASFLAKTMVLVFRLSIDYLLIVSVVRLVRASKGHPSASST